MVVDQYLLGIGNLELSVQVATLGHSRMEYILQVSRLLEAVQEDENFVLEDTNPAPKKSSSQMNAISRPTRSNW